MNDAVNRQYILASRPVALPTAEEVPMIETPVPAAGEGEIVIRNLYMSLDPAIRGWMSDEPNYIPPIPVGTKVWATGIGTVVQSGSPDFQVGDLLEIPVEFSDFGRNAVMAAKQTMMIKASITAYSTAVGPSSETRKCLTFLTIFFIAFLQPLGPVRARRT